ncbi:uncharacterized protein LOC144374595 isoform X2 [Ictidomys tridecemlineatus]
MVEDLLGSAAALCGMARHEELGLLSAAEASLPLAGSAYLPAEAMELRLRTPVSKIRKWRQREIMKPVQDYNTASLLQEMCRRRSHVPQKADFSLVKDCQSWRGKATVSFTSHSRLPQMFANSFRGR